MIGMNGLALMGLAPPSANAPPSQDAADGSSGFAQVIVAALAAADGGGVAQQPNASTGPKDIGTMDLEAVLQLLGELELGETQDLTWPDRIAEAGTAEAPAGTATEIAYAGQLPAAAVAALSGGAGPPRVVHPSGARPLADAAFPAQLPAQARAASLPVPPSGAGLPRIVQPLVARPLADAGFPVQLPAQARAASLPAPPSGVGVGSASASGGTAGGTNATAGASAAPETQVEGVPYGPPEIANARASAGLTTRPAPPEWAGVPGEGAASADGMVRASGVAIAATASVEHPAQAVRTAVGLGGFTGGVDANTAQDAAGSSASPAETDDARSPSGVEAGLRIGTSPAAEFRLAEAVEARDAPQLASRLANSVQRAVRIGADEFRLELHPPELGQLRVRVVETADGVRVTVAAASREATELIQQQLPLLRLALEARELRVDRLDIFQADLSDPGDAGAEPHGRSDDSDGDQPLWSPLAGMDFEPDGDVSRPPVRITSGAVDVMA